MKRLLLLLAFFLPGLPAARSAEPAVPNQPAPADPAKLEGFEKAPLDFTDFNLHFEVLVVQVPVADGIKLLPQLRDPKQIDAAQAAILEMIAAQRARFVDWPAAISQSGERVSSESSEEVRYPVEFAAGRTMRETLETARRLNEIFKNDPRHAPGVPHPPSSGFEMPNDSRDPWPAQAGVPAPSVRPYFQIVTDDQKRGVPGVRIAFEPVPYTFDVRNTGIFMEVEPIYDPATGQIAAEVYCRHCVFRGMDKYTLESGERRLAYEVPRFFEVKAQAQVKTLSGQRLLLGNFGAPGEPGWMELFIYQATARPMRPAEPAGK